MERQRGREEQSENLAQRSEASTWNERQTHRVRQEGRERERETQSKAESDTDGCTVMQTERMRDTEAKSEAERREVRQRSAT